MPFTAGTGTAFSVAESEIALGIETTRGTPPAEPSYVFPVNSPKYDPKPTFLPDDSLQATMVQVNDEVPGLRYDSHGWDAYPYLDSFPILVRSELGSADNLTTAPTSTTLSAAASPGSSTIQTAVTVAAGSWITIGTYPNVETHKVASASGTTLTLSTPVVFNQAQGTAVTGLTGHSFSLLNNSGVGNQPPSVTIWDNDGEEWRQMTACQLDELNIKGSATAIPTYTCTWFGNAASTGVTAPSTSLTNTQAVAPWTFTALFGGTEEVYVEDWEFDFKRQVKEIPALTGQPNYYAYFANTLLCTAKLTLVEQAGSPWLSDLLSGTKQTFSFTLFDVTSGFAFNLYSTSAMFTEGSLSRDNKDDWVKVSVTAQFLPTTTDALAGGKSPVKITVANSISTSY